MAMLGLGYFSCAWLSRILSGSGGTMVSYWLPGGLFVAALLLRENRDWPWLMLSAAAANACFDLLHDPDPSFLVISLFCAANVAQAGAGAWLVRRWVTAKPALASLRELFGLIFYSGVIGSAIGATIAAPLLFELHRTTSLQLSWQIMWGGDLMAVLVLTPLILAFFHPAHRGTHGTYPAARVFEACLILGGLGVFTWYVMVHGGGISSPKAPALAFVLWAGIRFGLRGGSVAVFLLAVWLAFLNSHFVPPGHEIYDAFDRAFTLQVFVAMAALVGIVPPIVIGERDRTLAKLGESQEKFSKAFRASPDGLALSELKTGRYIEVNDGYCKLFGFSRDEMLSRTSLELGLWVDPNDRVRMTEALTRDGSIRHLEVRMHGRDGADRIIQLSADAIELDGKHCLVSVLHDVTDRIHAEAASRSQREVLEMMAGGQAMEKTLVALVRMLESQSPELIGSFLLLDSAGRHLRHGAAPSLPPEYIRAIDGSEIGPAAGSCGTAAYRGQPVFAADIATDPLWDNYRHVALPHGLRACWSTPVLDPQKKVLATFAVYRREPGLPDERCRQLIAIITHTAAICISRHQAETEREEAVARERHARIEYTLQLIAAQEAERKRIAAELHDSMGQNLLLIKNLAQAAEKASGGEVDERVATINHLATQCIAEARQISRDLRPLQLDHLGLKRALESMLEHTGQASTLELDFKIEPVDDLFVGDTALNLYRIVQESLNNVLKHARAARVHVRLERDLHEVALRIQDDGDGFEPQKIGGRKGLGLKNITERARMLGAHLQITSSPGHGTRIDVIIPIREPIPETVTKT
jgi:PAS domain S-box-containing protein